MYPCNISIDKGSPINCFITIVEFLKRKNCAHFLLIMFLWCSITGRCRYTVAVCVTETKYHFIMFLKLKLVKCSRNLSIYLTHCKIWALLMFSTYYGPVQTEVQPSLQCPVKPIVLSNPFLTLWFLSPLLQLLFCADFLFLLVIYIICSSIQIKVLLPDPGQRRGRLREPLPGADVARRLALRGRCRRALRARAGGRRGHGGPAQAGLLRLLQRHCCCGPAR